MVYFVGAGPGDVGLITVKGAALLKKADVVLYTGSLVDAGLIKKYCKKARAFNSAAMHLDETVRIMTNSAKRGKLVVRLHTGDPALYSAVSEQAFMLLKAGIPYEIIPGVSSAGAASARLKKELTVPGISQTVIFTRLEGRTKVPQKERLASLASHNATMCIFLSAGMIKKVVRELGKEYPSETPAAIVYRATWRDEIKITGTLRDIAKKAIEAGITRHAMIIVGGVLGEIAEGSFSRLYDREFSHSFRDA
ncbi:MAG: precorrin-4 C(11)-methyltransferase [Deltaproteobacteria bacterium]